MEEKYENSLDYAIGYIYQIAITPGMDPVTALDKIREISGKFINQ